MDQQLQQIQELMTKCGLSEEAASKICDSIIGYSNTYKAKIDEEYATRVEAARKICVEETEAYKLELARRLQVYLEARSQHIEQNIARQVAVREGEAQNLLSQVQSLLEGIPAGGDAALKNENTKLRQHMARLQEERDKAVVTANRQTALAEKVLRRNRLAESRLAQLESRIPSGRQQVNEGRGQRQRLDSGRTGGVPVTTRGTLTENQDPRLPLDSRRGNTVSAEVQTMNGLTPEAIAEHIDDLV